MSTNYHQQRPQTRTREYDVGLWNDRGSLLPVAGYIKGPASGQTVSFIDRTIHEALLSDQLAWVHNFRARNSISVVFTSQNRIVDHYGFLWGLHFSDSPSDEHFDGRQERKSTKSPPAKTVKTCHHDEQKKLNKPVLNGEAPLTKQFDLIRRWTFSGPYFLIK
jgi:hypothetical protein